MGTLTILDRVKHELMDSEEAWRGSKRERERKRQAGEGKRVEIDKIARGLLPPGGDRLLPTGGAAAATAADFSNQNKTKSDSKRFLGFFLNVKVKMTTFNENF